MVKLKPHQIQKIHHLIAITHSTNAELAQLTGVRKVQLQRILSGALPVHLETLEQIISYLKYKHECLYFNTLPIT